MGYDPAQLTAYERAVRAEGLAEPYANQRVHRGKALLRRFPTTDLQAKLLAMNPEEAVRAATPEFDDLAPSSRGSYIAHAKAFQEWLRRRDSGDLKAAAADGEPAGTLSPMDIALPGRLNLVSIRNLPASLRLREVERIARALRALAIDAEGEQ